MKWSILILTIHTRTDYVKTLVDHLSAQACNYKDVEIIWLGDNINRSTGEKRQLLLDMAKGEYVSFVDDDDRVSDEYIDTIYPLLDGVDCVNFRVRYCNGELCKDVLYNRDYQRDSNTKEFYLRLPNHLMCVRRDLARKSGYDSDYIYEDRNYAQRLRGHLKSQKIIDKVLYYYDFDATVSETLKHLKK